MDLIREKLFQFWSSFGVPAFNSTFVVAIGENGTLITPPLMPYIVFNVSTPPAFTSTMLWANIYDFSTSFAVIDAIKNKVSEAIPDISGTAIDTPNGLIRLLRGVPFMQDLGDPDDVNIRRTYINYELRNLSAWG